MKRWLMGRVESVRSAQTLAGHYHLVFCYLYVGAILFHIVSALAHFKEADYGRRR